MGLRATAEADLAVIMEDEATGNAWPITVTDPDCNKGNLFGISDDIAQVIDPETGQAVSGRLASAALRIKSLADVGLGIPKAIADEDSKPWVIEFNDINGNPFKFKVSHSNPDRMLGIVTLLLEVYE
jgi:hypothetical protein